MPEKRLMRIAVVVPRLPPLFNWPRTIRLSCPSNLSSLRVLGHGCDFAPEDAAAGAATVVETLKLLLSAICTLPLLVSLTGADDPRENVNGYGGAPAFPVIAFLTADSSPGTLP